MRNVIAAWFLFLLAAALLFTTGACGSGGAASPAPVPSAELTASPYCWLFWSGDVSGPEATTIWGTVTPDGADTIDAPSLTENDNGTVTPQGPLSLTYAPTQGKAMGVFVPGFTLLGGVAEGGDVAALTMASSSHPTLLILGRKGAGFSAASLTGDYHLCALFRNGATNSELTWWGGTATFDGAGNCTAFVAGVNNNTAITLPGAPVPLGTYTVAGDGTMVWTPGVGGPWHGGLFGGGELAILAGSTLNGVNLQFLVFLIRKGAGLGNAAFRGAYHLAGISAVGGGFLCLSAPADADGGGGIALGITTANQDSNIVILPGGDLDYTVADDGTLSLTGGDLLGGISPSGRFAVVAGATTVAVPPILYFFVR